ncbi:Protein N-acetyltransferase, RimJ/RimL family [Blastococcus aggregatus]|uniref:Protein N-acetyltransferase, RimJ/RimL family n=1 Tax=Blastococcus aggregatus TaxID=38502 RepID=A0A285VGX5_9ACTN|nr:GNAT family N-acetyltransferase [Blastococcus aggregatus]SOC52818.1 Protein N-acetyltransferase, RimJ/RimL family [Blastococcus aggregatus]
MIHAPWPAAVPLSSPRLALEPLQVSHATEAATAFGDAALHQFTGGAPATEEQLRARYARQVHGHSPDRTQGWLNWMLRRHDTGELIGTVQATLTRTADNRITAELAWIIATSHHRQHLAKEAAAVVVAWLFQVGVADLVAHIHPHHLASAGVARHLGLHPTPVIVDGEVEWRLAPGPVEAA